MSGAELISHLQGILLTLTVVIFCGIAAWAYSPKSRKSMDDNARIPLRDDH
jgi:cbb3-type cytochrome oxidase subunit 3